MSNNKESNRSQIDDIEKYLSMNLKLLSCIGLDIRLNGQPVVEENKLNLKKIPASLIIALGLYAAVCQIIFIAEAMKNNDYFLAAQVTSQIFPNLLCMSKGYRLVTAVTKLDILIQELSAVWREYVPHHQIRAKVLKRANSTLLFCKVFVIVTFSAVLSFGVPALRNLVLLYIHRNAANYTCNYNERVFFMKYPFAINDPVTYLFVVLEEECLLLVAALFWICGDTFFAQLTTHASLHFEMLRYDIDSLITNQSSDIILKKNIDAFIMRHKRLLRICQRIEDIYSPIVLVTVLISSINICFNMFELSETINSKRFADASVYCFILINTFLQIVFYCVFAETLTKEISAIGDAIYKSKWTDRNCKIRLYVQMLIIKSQKSFHCTAYGFFPIGHRRLTMCGQVLNTAFSYYMMLRTTTNVSK